MEENGIAKYNPVSGALFAWRLDLLLVFYKKFFSAGFGVKKKGLEIFQPLLLLSPLLCEKPPYALAASTFLGLACKYFFSMFKTSACPSGIWRSAFWLNR